MARIETVLSVFVASPSDVADARKRLERVVDELNFLWSREYGLRLELVKWETHAYSDIGTDPQDVINKQLNQFDVFLGIMWKRFGTPTGRAESGTKEEFNRARDRHANEPKTVRVMFYFKNAPPESLEGFDPKQFAAVQEFRSEVGNAGVLYWTYESLDEFEALVRQHLARQVQSWGKSWGGVVEESTPNRQTQDEFSQEVPPSLTRPCRARSIMAIAFEQLEFVDQLRQRTHQDPDVIHRSFLEAQVILDSSPENDVWGELAARQAAALVTVALTNRLEPSAAAETYVANVCNCILGLRGLRIDWESENAGALFVLASAARNRHDDEVLEWITERASG